MTEVNQSRGPAGGNGPHWAVATVAERVESIRELWTVPPGAPYRGKLGRVSEIFDITRTTEDDWFDVVPAVDSPLHVDPFLMFSDTDPQWADSQQMFVGFFDMIAKLSRAMRDAPRESRLSEVVRFLQFPEPREFALGVSVGHSKGSGIGVGLGTKMAEALEHATQRGLSHLERPEVLTLLCDGIGLDLTSDITVTVLKSKFISYTQQIAERHGLKTVRVEVKNSQWSRLGWRNEWVKLPVRTGTRSPILLVPQRFLRPITNLDAADLFDWARANHAAELRDAVNALIQSKLASREKLTRDESRAGGKTYASSYPGRAQEFLQEWRSRPTRYNFDTDPQLSMRWLEVGRAKVLSAEPIEAAETPEELPRFVQDAVGSLKDAVERRGMWKAFWDPSGAPRPHRVWQSVCVSYLGTLCEQAGGAVSRPFDMARDFVDVQSRSGMARPVRIYLTDASNMRFTAAERKLPSDTRRDDRKIVAIVAVAFDSTPRGLTDDGGPLQEAHRDLAAEVHTALPPVVIEARPRGML